MRSVSPTRPVAYTSLATTATKEVVKERKAGAAAGARSGAGARNVGAEGAPSASDPGEQKQSLLSGLMEKARSGGSKLMESASSMLPSRSKASEAGGGEGGSTRDLAAASGADAGGTSRSPGSSGSYSKYLLPLVLLLLGLLVGAYAASRGGSGSSAASRALPFIGAEPEPDSGALGPLAALGFVLLPLSCA